MELMNEIIIEKIGENYWAMNKLDLPNTSSVYFIYNDRKDLIYIGRSEKLLDRTIIHFRLDKWFKLNARWISYTETSPDELRQKEIELIKEFSPCFNKRAG